MTEHKALQLAIEALNTVPNYKVKLEGNMTTHNLISKQEKAHQTDMKRSKLEQLAPRMYETLLLCEDALTELGRANDGTPSIQALKSIQVIKKEAGYPQLVRSDRDHFPEETFHVTNPLYGSREPERDIEPER